MPYEVLPLEEMKARIDEMKARAKEWHDLIADLRASGLDALAREEELAALEAETRKWETLYSLQLKRAEAGS